MHIVVFGANGKVGTLVVQKLLKDGHNVRAFVHSNTLTNSHKNLEVIEGDVHDATHVRSAVGGTDAVMSALGSWGTTSKDILTAAMRTIVPAMQETGISRIVSLTGSGARDSVDKPNSIDRLNRFAIRLAASKILEDGESHIALLRKSGLSWTVIRSPAMRSSVKVPSYRLSTKAPLPWETIARDEVANAMVELITNKEWLKASPFIRKK